MYPNDYWKQLSTCDVNNVAQTTRDDFFFDDDDIYNHTTKNSKLEHRTTQPVI